MQLAEKARVAKLVIDPKSDQARALRQRRGTPIVDAHTCVSVEQSGPPSGIEASLPDGIVELPRRAAYKVPIAGPANNLADPNSGTLPDEFRAFACVLDLSAWRAARADFRGRPLGCAVGARPFLRGE